MDRESLENELEITQNKIDALEEMYMKSLQFIEYNDELDLDMDFTDLRDWIDEEITKYKENVEKIEQDLDENNYHSDNSYLSREYERSVWAS